MQGRCLDIASISRYLHQLAELEDVLHVEGHVSRCARCRDKLQRMKRHTEALFDDHASDEGAAPPCCPSLLALDHFLRDGLSERQMIRIQEHLRGCEHCRHWAVARRPEAVRPCGATTALLATRAPDLDLRVATFGVRVAAGAEWLDLKIAPTLAERLDLPEPAPPQPYVAHARQLHVRRELGAWTLRGRVDLFGPEGFRFSARLEGATENLVLWTRSRLLPLGARTPGAPGVAWLLEPGHYFLGLGGFETPLFALCVESDFLAPASLAASGYDACRYGRFRWALSCFTRAMSQSPGEGVYAELHHRTRQFADRFGLAAADGDWRWREATVPSPRRPPLRRIDLAARTPTPARIAELVGTLGRWAAEASAEGIGPGTVLVSRRRFRAAFATFLPRLHRLLPTRSAP